MSSIGYYIVNSILLPYRAGDSYVVDYFGDINLELWKQYKFHSYWLLRVQMQIDVFLLMQSTLKFTNLAGIVIKKNEINTMF